MRGRVVQTVSDGVLVDGVFKTGDTQSKDIFAMFFLMGLKNEAFEGQNIHVKAVPAGTYTYTTVLGASSTIRALRYDESAMQPRSQR